MKVFFTLDSLAMGGTERSTLDIVSHFSKATAVTVIYFYKGEDLKAAYQKAGIHLQHLEVNGRRNFISGIRQLVRLIKKEKPDIIVSSISRADIITRIAGRLTGTPVIGTFVNDTYGESRIKEQKERKTYLKFLYSWFIDKRTAPISKYWISNCKSIAISNKKALKIADKKIQVIYRGRDTTQFAEWQEPNTEKQFRFVFVGRLIERKGLQELIQAFHALKKNHPEVHLDIYGAGGFGKWILEYTKTNQLEDSVILHGSVVNGFRKLYDAHCFLFPSWYEGFSGSLVEAMIAGIPIIASDITMNMEAVTPDKTALVFPVKEEAALLERMQQMLRDYPHMKEMGKRARAEALQRFDIRVIAKKYEQFLESVVMQKVDQNELI